MMLQADPASTNIYPTVNGLLCTTRRAWRSKITRAMMIVQSSEPSLTRFSRLANRRSAIARMVRKDRKTGTTIVASFRSSILGLCRLMRAVDRDGVKEYHSWIGCLVWTPLLADRGSIESSHAVHRSLRLPRVESSFKGGLVKWTC